MIALKPLTTEEVLWRLRVATDSPNDAQLAKHLDIPQSTVSAWKKRGVIPYEACVKVAIERGMSLDVFIFGDILPRGSGLTPIHNELFEISWNLALKMTDSQDINVIKDKAIEVYNSRAKFAEKMRGRIEIEDLINEYKMTDSVYNSK